MSVRWLSRLPAASAAVLLLTAPLAAQDGTGETVVTESRPAPAVADLQTPSERVGEYADLDGARIFYEAAGDGPPMLLLHGYPLSGALFARVRDALQDDFTVITLDHRGYGLSEAPDIPNNIETYAGDALAVLDALGIEQAIIGGMSMGGPIVLSMYEQSPQRFSGMILIDTNAAAAAPPEAGLWRGVDEVLQAEGIEPLIPGLLPDMLSGQTRLEHPEVGEYLGEIMRGSSLEAWRGGAQALADRSDFTAMLSEIEVPTLVLIGLEDALYDLQVSRDMHMAIPNSTLAIIPGASHAAIFEAPGASAAAIASWADGL